METIEGKANAYLRNNVNDKIGSFLSITFPKISANKWTMIGFFASLFAAFIVVKYGLLWGTLAIAIASSFDWIDGAVARARKKESRFGALLDDIVDRLGEIFYFIAIYKVQPSLALVVAGLTSLLVSYFNADGERRGFKMSAGKITGRLGRIVLLLILMLISPLISISLTLWLVVALNILTIVRRGSEIYQQIHR